MSDIHAGAPTPSLPFAQQVRHVGMSEPFGWVAAGWRDFRAAPSTSLAFGLVFVVLGWALTAGLWRADELYLLAPLASGFFLVGPALTLAFQAISRDLERGAPVSFVATATAWRANAGAIFNAGLALMFLFLLWLRLAQLLFALTFPLTVGFDAPTLLRATFFTPAGLEFLGLFVALGAVMAALAFAGGAFVLPMLLDRKVSMSDAIATSYAAVVTNLRPMALWAALLVAIVAAGMALFYVGLVVALPVAGHAAWHAYRATIRPSES